MLLTKQNFKVKLEHRLYLCDIVQNVFSCGGPQFLLYRFKSSTENRFVCECCEREREVGRENE